MAIYLLNADLDAERAGVLEHKLRTAIPNPVKINNIEGALQGETKPSEEPSTLLLIGPPSDRANLEKLSDIAIRHRDRIFFVLIGDEISASEYKSLVRTGGADWISASADVQEILELVANRRARRAEASSGVRGGSDRIAISFVPSAGGVGNTTLAVDIGVTLKTGKPTKSMNVCIVDLDFQSGHVCDYLDIEPRLKMQEISSNPERLDAQLFDIFISRHTSGLHVFAAPRSKTDPCDLNVAALDRLFDMISARYQLILIDLPVTWFTWTSQILSASDGIVVTGVNTIPGLRQTAETLAAARAAARASGQIAIAVNRCQRRLWGGIARRHHVDSVLGRENVFCVAEDPMALESVNTGAPMALSKGNRSTGRDIAALAGFCANVRSLRAASAG